MEPSNLAELAPAKLMRELQSSQQWLAEHFGTRTVPVISYPYGRADERVWHAARDAGYEAGVMIDGGWITQNPHQINTMHFHALTSPRV